MGTATTGRLGRVTRGLGVAMAVAALLLTIGITGSSAQQQKYETSVGQQTFVDGCRKTGGKPSRVSSRVVKCDHGDGTSTTCNFNTSPATCTYVSIVVVNAGRDHVDTSTVGGVEETTPKSGSTEATGNRATLLISKRDD